MLTTKKHAVTFKRLAGLAIASGALLLPAAAQAAQPTCTYDPALKRVNVEFSTAGTTASVLRSKLGAIVVNDALCGAADVTNTDLINVVDTSGGAVSLELDMSGGSFAPGAAQEAGSAEIEVFADLGAGQGDTVEIVADDAGSVVFAGASGVNLNAATELEGALGTDADLKPTGVDELAFYGGPGHDLAAGVGGRGTGAQFDKPMLLHGGSLGDGLYGGLADDYLEGGDGNDEMSGDAGDDLLAGGPGDDLIGGMWGNDTVTYGQSPGGVTVDLGRSYYQDTGSAGKDQLGFIDAVVGSDYADTLLGDDVANDLDGAGGNDLLIGRGGDDSLHGSAGDDRLRGGGGDDVFYGDAGRDAVDYADATAGVHVGLGIMGVAQASVGAGMDTIATSVEDLDGSPFADVLTGNAGANALRGGGGADALTGEAGPDLLDGGADADQVHGDDGEPDTIVCDPADNRMLDPIDVIVCPSAPATSGGAAGGTGAPTTGDSATAVTKPGLAVKLLRPTARSRRRGVRLALRATADVRATVALRVSRRTARRLGVKRRLVGRATGRLTAGGRRVLIVDVAAKARHAPLALRATAIDAAGRRSEPVTLRVPRR